MDGAPGFEDPEIGLVGLAGGWSFRCTDEIVSLLDQVLEASGRMREIDELVFPRKNSGYHWVSVRGAIPSARVRWLFITKPVTVLRLGIWAGGV